MEAQSIPINELARECVRKANETILKWRVLNANKFFLDGEFTRSIILHNIRSHFFRDVKSDKIDFNKLKKTIFVSNNKGYVGSVYSIADGTEYFRDKHRIMSIVNAFKDLNYEALMPLEKEYVEEEKNTSLGKLKVNFDKIKSIKF